MIRQREGRYGTIRRAEPDNRARYGTSRRAEPDCRAWMLLVPGAAALLAAGLLGCGGVVEVEAETGAGDAALAGSEGASAVAPPTSGAVKILRGHWKLDETGGTEAADAAGDNNGTLTDMPGTEWTTGSTGGALRFNGSGYVRVPDDDSLDLTKEVTVAAWIYLTDASGDQEVVQKGNNYALFEIREGGTPQNVLDVGGDESWETCSYTRDASWFLNAWHHVAFTYDGSRVVNYIDGQQDGEAHAHTGDMATNWDWLGIGTNGAWASAFFKGRIDDVRVYGKALTAEEIREVHQEARPGRPSPEPRSASEAPAEDAGSE